jgi:hypothetical protein
MRTPQNNGEHKMKQHLKSVLLLICLALLIAQPVQAGPDRGPQHPRRGEVSDGQEQVVAENAGNYVALSFGKTGYVTSLQGPVEGILYEELEPSGTSTGLTFGLGLSSNFMLELGYADYGKAGGMLHSLTTRWDVEATAIQVAGVAKAHITDWFELKLVWGIEKWDAEILWVRTSPEEEDIRIEMEEGADPFWGMGLVFPLSDSIDLSIVYDDHSFMFERVRGADDRLVEIKQTKLVVELPFD